MFKKLCKIGIFLLIYCFIIIYCIHPITEFFNQQNINQDLGLHLKLGEIIFSKRFVPTTNLLSYTNPNFSYINSNWLSELIFYLMFRSFGFNGLIYIYTLLFSLAFIFPVLYSFKKGYIVATSLGIFMGIIILFTRLGIRPEFFSYVYLSFFVTLLCIYRNKFTWLILLLIPAQLLWSNTHIYFIYGIIILIFFCIDQIVLNLLLSETKWQFDKKNKVLLFVTITSILCVFINPHGFAGAIYPLTFSGNYGISVSENNSILYNPYSYHRINIALFVLWVCLLIITQVINRKKVSLFYWLLTICFSLSGIFVTRLVALIIFATFIPFTENLSHTGNLIVGYFIRDHKKKEIIHATMLLSVIILIIVGIQNVIHTQGFGVGLGDSVYKGNGPKYFLANNMNGQIFNNYDIGSYLDFWLYPKEKVFIDTRPEAYPSNFLQNNYTPIQQNPKNFEKIDAEYKFNSILLAYLDGNNSTTLLLQQIVNNPHWKLVYLDDFMVIFVKNTKNNATIINKFTMTQKNIHIINANSLNADGLYRISLFFRNVGWNEDEESMLSTIMAKYPTYCPALSDYIDMNIQRGSSSVPILIARYKSIC